jgi:hypothetical protein
MEELKKGHCDTCGFLVMRVWGDTVFYEATQEYREKGVDVGASGSSSRPPLCIVLAARLDKEVEEHTRERAGPNMSNTEYDLLPIIQKPDRDCSKWRKWEQGFSPKEHREMMDRQWMLNMEDKRDTSTREWQAEQEAKRRRFQLWLAVLSGLMVILAAMVGALYGVYVQRDVDPPNITIQMPASTPTPIPTFTPTPTPMSAPPTPPASK